MNKKISPTLIGVFVVGAVALIVIAILVFGSGRLFRQSRDFVLYFDNSVNGLRVGAPVKFKGVEIGQVKRIKLRLEDIASGEVRAFLAREPASYLADYLGRHQRGLSLEHIAATTKVVDRFDDVANVMHGIVIEHV